MKQPRKRAASEKPRVPKQAAPSRWFRLKTTWTPPFDDLRRRN